MMLRAILLLGSMLLAASAHATPPGWDLRVCAEPNNLPFSNRAEEGFENRIARIVARELGAQLEYVWIPQPKAVSRSALMREGDCDLVMGLTDGHGGFLTTHAYYRSTYVFVHRADAPFKITSFDDERLKTLRIGVPFSGEHTSPPTQAIVNRNLQANLVPFGRVRGSSDPLSDIIEAVAAGELDVAVAWGPTAAFFAGRQSVPLALAPVSPEVELPFVPMVFPIAMGVRSGDTALRDRLNRVLAARWDEIQAVLDEFDVPRAALPRPMQAAAGSQR